MTQSDGNLPDRDRPELQADEAGDDNDLSRLARIDVPSSPAIPPPPHIEFQRPTLGQSKPGTDESRPGHATNVKIGADRPRHHAPRARSATNDVGTAGALMGAGITFAASVVVGVIAGQWIDHRFGWAPWGTIALVLAGIAAGFVNLFRLLAIEDRSSRNSDDKQH